MARPPVRGLCTLDVLGSVLVGRIGGVLQGVVAVASAAALASLSGSVVDGGCGWHRRRGRAA